MKHNLLMESQISVSSRTGQKEALSLPELFAAMARQEVARFEALRVHQSPAWHMFLVQLAALALWPTGKDCPPADGKSWTALLRQLTGDFAEDEPWCMIVENPERPAFLQPPCSSGLRWKPVPTPDNLDILNSSKNFDVKHAVGFANEPEDWLYALVSVQTMAGYSGRGNHGIVRMSSGLSSRPLLGLAPGSALDRTADASAWWARDVRRLLQGPRSSDIGTVGGPALLWCLPWKEGEKLRIPDLDPLFIEVCRRVRLTAEGAQIMAQRSTSLRPRIDAGAFKGNIGDPWIPVESKRNGKSLTLGKHGFTYIRLCELLFSGDWERPVLAQHGPEETGGMVLIAEALARGRHKTEGFHARRVPIPGRAAFESGAVRSCARQQLAEVKALAAILRNSLAVYAAGGDWRRLKKDKSRHKLYERAQSACRRWQRHVDRVFFEALLERVAANQKEGGGSVEDARVAFLADLLRVARAEFARALPLMSCPSARRRAAEDRARETFRIGLRRHFPELLEQGELNGPSIEE